MKKVIFKKIVIQNFLSAGEDPISVDFKRGINLIVGKNLDKPDRQNGVGKSMIADAIYFAIFGDTLRTLKKEFVTNNITGGKTQVELKFDISTEKGSKSYHVIRTLSPTKVFLYEDGEDKTRDSIANTTKYICDILSASPAVFQNCVIMTVNNATPFMAKNKVEKRKFIEDIFGLEVFSKMLNTVRQDFTDVKKDLDIQQNRFDDVNKNYTSYCLQRDRVNEKRSEKKLLYITRQKNNEEELDRLNYSINSLKQTESIEGVKSIIDDLQHKDQQIDNLINEYIHKSSTLKATILHKKEQYTKIGTSDSKCPVCLKQITDHDQELIDSEKNSLKKEIENLANQVSDINEKISKVKEKKEQLRSLINIKTQTLNNIQLSLQNIANLKSRITQLNEWQEELKNDIQSIDDGENEFDSLVEEARKTLASIEDSISSTNRTLNKLETIKFVVSEEGVKSFIVSKLLKLLNSKLHHYLRKLDSNSNCMFNEYFEEEITNEKGKICSYFNFSGAERKAIDLACLFAFSDIRRMQGGVSYNISIYDELFDSSFDSKGIELVTDILSERVDIFDECSVIISHRREAIKCVTGEVISLEKENGITRRVLFEDEI